MTAWPAPAKINLFLHITGRREDGYHELQTAFQFLDYCDYLNFEVTKQPAITLLTPLADVAEQDNLIIHAASLLQKQTGIKQGVQIRIDKKLPMGGGLGGGSSNAATTLVALNQLWNSGLDTQQLTSLGIQLGADVPVFIVGHAAWAEGVGEKLTPITPVELWYVVLVPDCYVSTAEIFASAELTRDCIPITISRLLLGGGRNVCEPVVKKRYPQVAQALQWLAKYAPPRMTGTGASVFAAFDEQAQAQQVIQDLPDNWRGFVARGTNVSPLIAVSNDLKKSAVTA